MAPPRYPATLPAAVLAALGLVACTDDKATDSSICLSFIPDTGTGPCLEPTTEPCLTYTTYPVYETADTADSATDTALPPGPGDSDSVGPCLDTEPPGPGPDTADSADSGGFDSGDTAGDTGLDTGAPYPVPSRRAAVHNVLREELLPWDVLERLRNKLED